VRTTIPECCLRPARNPLVPRLGWSLLWLAAVLLAACATTRLKDTWKDPQFNGVPFRNILVIGVSRSDANRRLFEDGFVQALRASGIEASASYPLLPGNENPLPKEGIEQAVAETGADSVLVTRVLRVQRNVDISPGYVAPGGFGGRFYGWYGTAWETTPEVHTYDVLTIESTLWNVKRERAVWSGTSESTEPKNVTEVTQELAKLLIAKMREDRVL
jgi:hypothetical protein